MFPSLSDKEVGSTVDSVMKKREGGTLTIYYNEPRRILFNPNCGLSTNEKMAIVNRELGKLKSDVTKELIYAALENWDYESDGPITQKKVCLIAGRGIATVKRHWNDFKEYVQTLNDDFGRKETETKVEPKAQGITIEKYIDNMRCKFTTMEPSDERFLRKAFKERGITHSADEGFDEVHQWMFALLKSRQLLYRAA